MSNFYIDPVNGNNANDGLGPYKAAYTSGGTTPIAVGDTVTGGTSGKTAKVVYITVTSGSWAGGDAAGSIYVGTPSGAFTDGEALLVGGNDLATLTANFAVSSWLTAKDGATAARIAAGDEIRIKSNSNPVSIGSATFTKDSATVAISARTKGVCDCSSAWTPSANVSCGTNGSTSVDGNNAATVTPQSAFTTGLLAYWPLGSAQDFSAYSKISLAIYANANFAAGLFQLCLCSDAAGATPVNTLNIPQLKEYVSHAICLDNGSALGASIQSVALYATSDPGTSGIVMDNIIATNDICHGRFIGLNDGKWVSIRAISQDGASVYMGMTHNGFFYCPEDTVTATGYFQDAYEIGIDTDFIYCNESGSSATSPIKYTGGWNFSTDTRDGDSFAMARSNTYSGVNLNGNYYLEFSHLYFSMFICGFYINSFDAGNLDYIKVDSVSGCLYANYFFWSYYGSKNLYLTGTIYAFCQYFLDRPSDTTSIASLYSDATIYFFPYGSDAKFFSAAAVQRADFFGKVTMKCGGPSAGYRYGAFVVQPLGQVYFAEVVVRFIESVLLFSNNLATNDLRIAKLTIMDSVTNFIATTNSSHGFNAHIMNLVLTGGATISNSFSSTNPPPYACVKVDRINADGRFARYFPTGTISDQVTGGQAEAWAQGGSGSCLYMNPGSTNAMSPTRFDSFIFAPAAGNYKLKFDVKKTSSGANCVFKVSVFGNVSTPIRRETVTLTDSWASFESATFTTEYAGFVHVFFEAWDGSTTGDIGIDNIELEAQ